MRIIHVAALCAALAPAVARAESRETNSSPVAGAEDESLYHCTKGSNAVVVTLKPETEVKDLLSWVNGFLCKNVILDPRSGAAQKKVTIMSPNKLTPAEAYRMFLIALSTVNLTVVAKDDKTIVIMDAPKARANRLPIYIKDRPPATDEVVRFIYRPGYIGADSLSKSLLTVKSDAGDIQTIGSMLMITDYGNNVRDMKSIIEIIDVPGATESLYAIPLKHTDVTKVAPKLEQFLGFGGSGAAKPPVPAPGAPGAQAAQVQAETATPTKMMVDERTNTIIVLSSKAGYDRVKALIETIDIEIATEGGAQFHVYPLGNAIAEELAQTLNAAISGRSVPPSTPLGQKSATPATTPPNTAPGMAPTTARPIGPAASSALDAIGAALEGQVHIIGDKPTNSLIVMASGRDFLALRSVIRELDLPRRQVYIEAMILEVNVADALDVGVVAHGGIPTPGGSVMVGGVEAPSLKSTNPASLAGANGLIGGLIGKALPGSTALFGQSIPSYSLMFQALQNTASTNIVSAPSIIAVDNEEAKYKVGTNIPYLKGQVGVLPAGADSAFQSQNIDRKDLQLELDIKPHISNGDMVFLEIKHDSADLGDNIANLGPSWNTRSFETRVVVRDQQTVVIGGLMQERHIKTESKVPLLGDIPLFGRLFKYSSTTKKKSNLVLLLTPYIVKDQLELQALREKKLRDHDEFVRSFHGLQVTKYQPKIDYRRKRGVVEEINRSVLDVDAEIESRQRLQLDVKGVKPGPIEIHPD